MLDAPPDGYPSVRLEPNTLTIDAGPLPQYPLYYARDKNDEYIVTCSRLEPLASLFPRAALNGQRLVSLMDRPANIDSAETVYMGVQRLRPCETIVASREVLMTREFPHVGSAYRRGSVQDLAAELRHRLDTAVGRAIGRSKRVAVFVSGGLDSSGVLALAAARRGNGTELRLDALSIHHAGPGDDRPYFNDLTASLDLAPVRLSPRDAGKWFTRSLMADAQPILSSSVALGMLLGSTAVERKADVVLTGTSGDRICGGILPFANLVRRGHPLAAISGALRVRVPWQWGPAMRLRTLVFSPLIPAPVRRLKHRFDRFPRWATPRSRDLLGRCRADAAGYIGPLPDTPDGWMERLCTWDYLLDVADVNGQLAAISGCAPMDVFLDLEFVRFMVQVDPFVLSHGHEFRGLYRLAMKGVLPERLRTRQDKGDIESALGAAALAADAFDLFQDLSSLEALRTLGLVDPAGFREAFDACMRAFRRGERADEDPADEQILPVWQLLSVEAFVREFGKGRNLG